MMDFFFDPRGFPFLFGGTFIEGPFGTPGATQNLTFPFLFGGTFIEGNIFSLLEPLSHAISLPFRRDFH